jgi:hypothetical protein
LPADAALPADPAPAGSWRQHVAATLEAAGTLAEPFVVP